MMLSTSSVRLEDAHAQVHCEEGDGVVAHLPDFHESNALIQLLRGPWGPVLWQLGLRSEHRGWSTPRLRYTLLSGVLESWNAKSLSKSIYSIAP